MFKIFPRLGPLNKQARLNQLGLRFCLFFYFFYLFFKFYLFIFCAFIVVQERILLGSMYSSAVVDILVKIAAMYCVVYSGIFSSRYIQEIEIIQSTVFSKVLWLFESRSYKLTKRFELLQKVMTWTCPVTLMTLILVGWLVGCLGLTAL